MALRLAVFQTFLHVADAEPGGAWPPAPRALSEPPPSTLRRARVPPAAAGVAVAAAAVECGRLGAAGGKGGASSMGRRSTSDSLEDDAASSSEGQSPAAQLPHNSTFDPFEESDGAPWEAAGSEAGSGAGTDLETEEAASAWVCGRRSGRTVTYDPFEDDSDDGPLHFAQPAAPLPPAVRFCPVEATVAAGATAANSGMQAIAAQTRAPTATVECPASMADRLLPSSAPKDVAAAQLAGSSEDDRVSHSSTRGGSALVGAAPIAVTSADPETSCTYLPGGVARIQWVADGRRFAGQATTSVSPTFSVNVPGVGPQPFKIIVHAASSHSTRGRSGFRGANGRAKIELKCEGQLPRNEEVYTVVLHKSEGARLGIDLQSKDGEPWCITAISSGLVQEWNEAQPLCPVTSGDSILEVNGVAGDLARIREACARVGPLRITLRRNSSVVPAFEVRFGVGAQPMRGPTRHNFADASCCGLPKGTQTWDLSAAVEGGSRKVRIHFEMRPASA